MSKQKPLSEYIWPVERAHIDRVLQLLKLMAEGRELEVTYFIGNCLATSCPEEIKAKVAELIKSGATPGIRRVDNNLLYILRKSLVKTALPKSIRHAR